MHVQADAEVVLAGRSEIPPTSLASFGFIVSFGAESFSAQVLPDGSGMLEVSKPQRVMLNFLVEAARPYLTPGRSFTFFEQGRIGEGRIL